MSPKDSNGSDLITLAGLFIIWYVIFCNNNIYMYTYLPSSHKLKPLMYFLYRYATSASYNVYNQKLRVDISTMPYTCAALQLVVGLFYAIPLWMLNMRKAPTLTISDILQLLPIIVLNTIGHVTAVVAMFQKGGGSLTHVIKASEPVVSVLLGIIVNQSIPKPLTALSLLPITYGVAYASTGGDLSWNKLKLELTAPVAILAMSSNIAFAMRSILRKNMSEEYKNRTGLKNPENDHCITTLLSFIICLVYIIYIGDHIKIVDVYSNIAMKDTFIMNVVLCGMSFYLYNEMQNKILSKLGAVSTAVGNTLKRVVIFIALYMFVEGETFSYEKVVGCCIAVAGCLTYSILDSMKI